MIKTVVPAQSDNGVCARCSSTDLVTMLICLSSIIQEPQHCCHNLSIQAVMITDSQMRLEPTALIGFDFLFIHVEPFVSVCHARHNKI